MHDRRLAIKTSSNSDAKVSKPRRVERRGGGIEGLDVSRAGAAVTADLGGSSKCSGWQIWRREVDQGFVRTLNGHAAVAPKQTAKAVVCRDIMDSCSVS